MRTLWISVLLSVLVVSSSNAQFKTQREYETRVSDGIAPSGSPSLYLGFFDPEKFHMQHSLSMSYMTFGGQGMSLGTYTNSMTYAFSDNLNARADVSMMYSPNSQLGGFSGKTKSDFSSLFLSRAEVNYRPWENVHFQVQFRQIPYTSLYSPFANPFYGDFGY
jgi:hypothetical protein